MKPWDAEERAWARDCLLAGDTVEEIAEAAGRSVADVCTVVGRGPRMTPKQRDVLSFYSAGTPFNDIAVECGTTMKSAASMIKYLRTVRRIPIPHRNNVAGAA